MESWRTAQIMHDAMADVFNVMSQVHKQKWLFYRFNPLARPEAFSVEHQFTHKYEGKEYELYVSTFKLMLHYHISQLTGIEVKWTDYRLIILISEDYDEKD